MKNYLTFTNSRSYTGNTFVWDVVNSTSMVDLGQIKWHGPWRRYCFYPYAPTIWAQNCLLEIVAFIEQEMEKRKMSKERIRSLAQQIKH